MRCSLLTPLKNEMDNIKTLWSSIQSQTVLPSEWIIMDNGSTDGTLEWLQAQAKKSPFPVRVLSLSKKTLAKMMNIAIDNASNDIIASCHGGTRISERWLENLLAPFSKDPELDVVGGTWEAYGDSSFQRWIAPTLLPLADEQSIRSYLPAARSLAFKRSAWQKVGGFPEWLPKFGEDTLFALRLRHAGCKMIIEPEAKVGWQPKSTVISFLRQERLYQEAHTLMGYPPPRIREFLRPWVLLPVGIVLFQLHAGFFLTLLFLILLPIVDSARLKANVTIHYPSISTCFFWKWVMPLVFQLGFLRAKWLGWRNKITAPENDLKAVREYLIQTGRMPHMD